MATKKSGGVWDTIKTLIYAVLIALFIRTFAFEPFNIPSGSMIPTLLVGDYLFVSKYSYGYSRHSLPLSLPLIPGRVLSSVPERGDVAVFKLPRDNSTDYIKRIVGLPGDKIQVREGRLYVNGEIVDRKQVKPFAVRGPLGSTIGIPQFEETLPNGVKHRILEQSDTFELDNTSVYTVPPGHVFGMGDNRDNSEDSRVLRRVGYIPMENLVGRAEFIFFSYDPDGSNWPLTVRWSRLFQAIR
jgi:signal peptidase I